jgi:hypothetical protein
MFRCCINLSNSIFVSILQLPSFFLVGPRTFLNNFLSNTESFYWRYLAGLILNKHHGGGALDVWATKVNFQVAPDIWRCVRSQRAANVCSNHRNLNTNYKCTNSWQIWGKMRCKTYTRNDLGGTTTQSCICCYGVTGIYTITELSVRRRAAKPSIHLGWCWPLNRLPNAGMPRC